MWRRRKKIGKNVGGFRYVHRQYINDLDEVDRVKVDEALVILEEELGVRNGEWNILKFTPGQQFDPPVTFLVYEDFELDPHPKLIKYYRVDASEANGKRAKEWPGRGEIIHRKELMVGELHPNRETWEHMTAQEEKVGLYDKEHIHRIGRLSYWKALLARKKVRHNGHLLFYIGGDERQVMV